MIQRSIRSKCFIVEEKDLVNIILNKNLLICPFCNNIKYKKINKNTLKKFSQHIRWHFIDGKTPLYIKQLIWDFYYGKSYCKICGKPTKFLGFSGYKKYCNECIKTNLFKKSENLDKDILKIKGIKISKAKIKFYKTKEGKRIAKIIGEKNKINTINFYKTKKGKQVRKEAGKKISISLKKRILETDYSPKTTNRRTHWNWSYDNIKFRSSWELEVYHKLIKKHGKNNVFYEKHRIPYISNKDNKLHIYIVDFSVLDKNTYTLIEVKPKELIKENMDKINSAKEYCNKNKYFFKIITGEDICKL